MRKQKEFNLSDEGELIENRNMYDIIDVKEFIERLKVKCTGITHCDSFIKLVDELAGKELAE